MKLPKEKTTRMYYYLKADGVPPAPGTVIVSQDENGLLRTAYMVVGVEHNIRTREPRIPAVRLTLKRIAPATAFVRGKKSDFA